ncbi:MAG: hypothetical protein N3A69_00475 [Leptospiraceae bacterium]|nr:hypothetical protein [Leptospiraceae bacterium]
MLFSKEALIQIEEIIKKPDPTLLRARIVANVKVASDKNMNAFRFFWYTPEGNAELYSTSQFASNIPIVGGKGDYVTVNAYTIANSFMISDSEIFASNQS